MACVMKVWSELLVGLLSRRLPPQALGALTATGSLRVLQQGWGERERTLKSMFPRLLYAVVKTGRSCSERTTSFSPRAVWP